MCYHDHEAKEVAMERKSFIGGSDLALLHPQNPFGCERKLWYLKATDIAPEPSEKQAKNYRMGHFFENALVEAFEAETGLRVKARNRFFPGDPPLGGTVDGVVLNGTVAVVECKTKSKRNFYEFLRNGPNIAETVQVSFYMRLVQAQKGYIVAGYPSFEDEEAILSYAIKEVTPLDTSDLEQKAREWWEAGKPEPPRKDPDSLACRFCPFARVCQTREELPAQEKNLPELIALLDRWETIHAVKTATEEEEKEVKEEIARFFTPGEKAKVGMFSVSYVSTTREELDRKALERDHPDLVAKYLSRKEIPPYLIIRKGK
jgi:predicted phage-related endonuclease